VKDLTSSERDDWNRHWEDFNQSATENPAQNYRRELIFSLLGLDGAKEPARILDVGSGQGDMAAALLSRFPSARILGLELSRSGVEISSRKVPNAQFVQRDLLDAAEPPENLRGWATHTVCSEVIEHVDDPAALLKNARRYMVPGGLLVLTAPGGPMSAFDKHIGHRKHWTPAEITSLLRAAGFTPIRANGTGFPFFNLYRCIVILRGQKLIDDVRTGSQAPATFSARAALAIFHQLIRKKLNSSSHGWQMIATARS
jgi:SAM-dependent methyltransferase